MEMASFVFALPLYPLYWDLFPWNSNCSQVDALIRSHSLGGRGDTLPTPHEGSSEGENPSSLDLSPFGT